MFNSQELTAYQSAVNLSLLNDIIAFVRDKSEASPAKRLALRQDCIFLDSKFFGDSLQKKYGFLYLGELLERYEERFGMSIQDFRAISLALAYTKELADDSMFIGPQRRNFIQQLKRRADGDIYLTGALYLLEVKPKLQSKLAELPASTEELIFAVSLFQNQADSFQNFKTRLLDYLGAGRTMPITGNMKAMCWLIFWLAIESKSIRGKDMALFRALTALPVSHVKRESKHHEILLAHGYTHLEIAYANMMSVLLQASPEALPQKSVTAQKIAVSLFQELFASEADLTQEVYQNLSEIYRLYARFQPRCYGCGTMLDALKNGPQIRTAKTLLWFAQYGDMYHPAFDGFDILDSKWDRLASALETGKYLTLFERTLSESLDADGIQKRIERRDALTGNSYLARYYEDDYLHCFNLLVHKDILNLWTCFQNSLDADGHVEKPGMLDYVRHSLSGLQTIQAFEFYKKFMDAYGVAGLERFFGYNRRGFYESCVVRSNSHYYSSQAEIQLNIQRPFLDNDGQRQLLSWLEEYIYYYEPDKYLDLTTAILQSDSVSRLYEGAELRKLFDAVITRLDLPHYCVSELKSRYLTEAERQADLDAQIVAKHEAEKQKKRAEIQKLQKEYDTLPEKNLAAAVKYLNSYQFYSERFPLACRIVRERLDGILTDSGFTLDYKEAAMFLSISANLVKTRAMTLTEAQSYISQLKEGIEHAE